MSEVLVRVLGKELGLGRGLAEDIIANCTPEQIQAANECVQNMKQREPGYRFDSWDKYMLLMTSFRAGKK